MNILLTDDDETVRKSVGQYLAVRGHSLKTASDGAQALKLMKESPPDLGHQRHPDAGNGRDRLPERLSGSAFRIYR